MTLPDTSAYNILLCLEYFSQACFHYIYREKKCDSELFFPSLLEAPWTNLLTLLLAMYISGGDFASDMFVSDI